ncbi:MAG: pyruvate, water dikinase regulatory protein [Pseudomonadota bacterium]
MSQRTVFFISDQTGVTAETLGHSLLTQFATAEFRQVTVPFVDSPARAEELKRKINQAATNDEERPIVFSSLVHDDLREIIKTADGLYLDIFDAFVGSLETELATTASHEAGRAHGMSDTDTYMKRIEATNYALANDDGGAIRNYEQADVILLGVSRSGKTPTCLYLALQYGVYAANFPLTEDEFESGTLPERLIANRKKLYGLTINPKRLQQIRKERRAAGRYASAQQVNFELRAAAALFNKYKIPYVDTTEFSIEEIASRILETTGVERRVRP